MLDHDIIVIGTGPAGSTAARLGAEHGWQVALPERWSFSGQHNVCGGGIEGDGAKQIGVPQELIQYEIMVLQPLLVEER